MAASDQSAEDYAREQLTNHLVAKGIDRAMARSLVAENVKDFFRVAVQEGSQLMVRWDDRNWPVFTKGITNPWNIYLADALWLEIPYAVRHPQPGHVVSDYREPIELEPADEFDPEEEQRRQMATRISGFL